MNWSNAKPDDFAHLVAKLVDIDGRSRLHDFTGQPSIEGLAAEAITELMRRLNALKLSW